MKIKFDYPVNGVDLSIYVEGDIVGTSREMHDLELWEVIAKLNGVEVFRYDGEDHGLLAETDLGEEIINTAKNILVEENFYDKV